ncbi:serine protease hepsin-like [Neocloeon triangulifer]|uniref:serine protease hepsin-like n=1 Tax=Neocloeon triangulifer TaxID=2078957 RepID=UPI00286EBAFC|nr:serine protease hepsin-like [Neocloeon triangulifer]
MGGSEVKASKLVVKLGMHSKFKAEENSRQRIFRFRLSWFTPATTTCGATSRTTSPALIVLRDEAKFNDFVMPICLWNENYNLKRIANKTGTVVGWGYTLDHQQQDILQEAQIKVVSYEECYESSRLFFSVNMRPRENFCAGFPQNRSGECNGDSGGGFVMKSEGRFFLRGVVSSGRSREVAAEGGARVVTCNPKYLALFTDVTNFMAWIVRNTPDFPPLPPPPENHPETSERPATGNTTKITKFPPQTFWDGLFSLILQHFDLKTIN